MAVADRRTEVLARLARWCRVVAVVLALLSVGNLIAWANRWYVTEQFARSLGSGDRDFAVWVYERMALAHEALLTGVLLAAAAVAVAALRRWIDASVRRAP